jgi:hypothetical protein
LHLTDLSSKFKRILALSLPHSSPDFAAVNLQDYDFGSWLSDVLPPMRPLVWSLVLRIFARFLEKGHCESEFDAAMLSAHTLPIETLKQIEVINTRTLHTSCSQIAHSISISFTLYICFAFRLILAAAMPSTL